MNEGYAKLIKLSDLPGVQPDGYAIRLVFSVLGFQDAHIALSPIGELVEDLRDIYVFGKSLNRQKRFANLNSRY